MKTTQQIKKEGKIQKSEFLFFLHIFIFFLYFHIASFPLFWSAGWLSSSYFLICRMPPRAFFNFNSGDSYIGSPHLQPGNLPVNMSNSLLPSYPWISTSGETFWIFVWPILQRNVSQLMFEHPRWAGSENQQIENQDKKMEMSIKIIFYGKTVVWDLEWSIYKINFNTCPCLYNWEIRK